MKVVHKNSREEFDLSIPCSFKYFGMYGLLVMGGNNVYFIGNTLEIDYVCVTDEFEIIK